MRRPAPRHLGAALAEVTQQRAPATVLARVQSVWADVAGPAVGAEAEPVAEREGTVTVECRSAVWAQELDLLARDLLARLNERLGASARVRGLRFVTASRGGSAGRGAAPQGPAAHGSASRKGASPGGVSRGGGDPSAQDPA